jgi:hypothetical protein
MTSSSISFLGAGMLQLANSNQLPSRTPMPCVPDPDSIDPSAIDTSSIIGI